MKRMSLPLLMILLLCSLTACGGQSEELDSVENDTDTFVLGDKVEADPHGHAEVSLSIMDGTLASTGATVLIENTSGKTIEAMFIKSPIIQVEQDGDWYALKSCPAVSDGHGEGWALAGTSSTVSMNWKSAYGELPAGHYRIVKVFWFSGENAEKYDMCTEFFLE